MKKYIYCSLLLAGLLAGSPSALPCTARNPEPDETKTTTIGDFDMPSMAPPIIGDDPLMTSTEKPAGINTEEPVMYDKRGFQTDANLGEPSAP